MQKELTNSYLTFHELIYHSAIIGFVSGTIEMLLGFYQVYTSDLEEVDSTMLLFLVAEPVSSFFIIMFYAVIAAVITYPFYKRWALRKGGLTIMLHTINNDEQNT